MLVDVGFGGAVSQVTVWPDAGAALLQAAIAELEAKSALPIVNPATQCPRNLCFSGECG